MKEKGKNALWMAGAAALVLVVGVANYLVVTGTPGKQKEAREVQQTAAVEEDVFEVFRQQREETRTQEMTYIDSVAQSAEADEKTKEQARQQKLQLAKAMEEEMIVEGLIRTKMNTEAVVTVKDGSVNVVVGKKELSDTEVTQIADIVRSETGAASQSIRIMPQL